jgi:hypothetical protein
MRGHIQYAPTGENERAYTICPYKENEGRYNSPLA